MNHISRSIKEVAENLFQIDFFSVDIIVRFKTESIVEKFTNYHRTYRDLFSLESNFYNEVSAAEGRLSRERQKLTIVQLQLGRVVSITYD